MHYYIYHLLSSPPQSYYYLHFTDEKTEAGKCYTVSGCAKEGASSGALGYVITEARRFKTNYLNKECIRK